MEQEYIIEEEAERGFRIRDILLYFVKKWWIFVIVAALGMAAGAGFMVLNRNVTVEYRQEIAFIDIPEFYAAVMNPGVPHEALVAAHIIARDAVFVVFTDEDQRFLLLQDAAAAVSLESMLGSRTAYSIIEEIGLEWHTANTRILRFSNTRRARHGALPDSYAIAVMEIFSNFMYTQLQELPRVQQIVNAGYSVVTISEPHLVYRDEDGYAISNIILGFVAGFVLAAVAVLIIFFIDPKMKSLFELERGGFAALEVLPDANFSDEELSTLSAQLISSKRVMLIEADGDKMGIFANRVAEVLASAGQKVLLMTQNENGKLKAFLDGAKTEEVLEKKGENISTLDYVSKNDFLHMLTKLKSIDTLDKDFDKRILALPNGFDLRTVSLLPTDAVVLLVDKNKATNRVVRNVFASSPEGVKRIGAIVHSAQK